MVNHMLSFKGEGRKMTHFLDANHSKKLPVAELLKTEFKALDQLTTSLERLKKTTRPITELYGVG